MTEAFHDVRHDDGTVGGQVNRAAAWTYRDPEPTAAELAGHVAFWRGVEVTAP